MNKSVNNPVNSPVNSPTNICVDSPVNSLHGNHTAAADESKNNEENIEFNEGHTDSNYLSLIPTVLQRVNYQKMMLK